MRRGRLAARVTVALVVGGTGRVGSGVVAALADRDRLGVPAAPVEVDADLRVRVASRDPDAARERLGPGPGVVAFDFEHPETWGRALEDVERLFVAFPPPVGVRPVRAFLDAARRDGVEHVVLLSVLGAERLPVLPHRRLERHLERTAPSYAFLRAAYFMQNLSGVHRPEVVDRDELFVPAGDGSLGFVDARDVGAAAAGALAAPARHRNRAFDLTGPASLDFHAVARAFSAVLERRIEYADPGRLTFARRTLARGVEPSLVAFMLAEYEATRRGLTGRTTDDLARLLGRDPTTVRTFVEDYRERFERRSASS
jgi:uncharacterized protein YbjT (DUF2867 family)